MYLNWVTELIFFVIVAVAIAFTVRYATDHKFRTTPMDYLIIAGIATIAVFGGEVSAVQGHVAAVGQDGDSSLRFAS